MSIRLRLTLLYSGILAFTLLLIPFIVFVTQSKLAMREQEARLLNMAELAQRFERFPPDGQQIPERILRQRAPDQPFVVVRNLDGDILRDDPVLAEQIILPLNAADFQADGWFQQVRFDDKPFLIFNQPIEMPDGETLIIQLAVSMAEQERYMGLLARLLFTVGAVVVVIAFVVGWFFAGLALSPINRITQTAHAIGTQRDFSQRVQHTGHNDEVGQLAATFNEMLTELESAYRQVEQSLHAQQRFVADASHELRTPLTTIRGNIDLLRRDPPISRDDQAEAMTDMVDETERLMRLTNDLLALARADAGQSLRAEKIDVADAVQEVYRQARLLTPQHRLVVAGVDDGVILGDRDALKQIMLALIDNALKHTGPDATITLSAAVADGQAAIAITDDGPGIAPERLPHIFDRFYRGDVARTGGGSGLGLSIVRELTEAQGGSIAVQSQSGQGSIFIVSFPLID